MALFPLKTGETWDTCETEETLDTCETEETGEKGYRADWVNSFKT